MPQQLSRLLEETIKGETDPRMRRIHGSIYTDNEMPTADIVDLWFRYNMLLAKLVERLGEEQIKAQMFIG